MPSEQSREIAEQDGDNQVSSHRVSLISLADYSRAPPPSVSARVRKAHANI